MRAFNYGNGTVSIIDTNHATYGNICHSWSKEEFESAFGISLDSWDVITYEPERNMFVVVDREATEVQVFNSPEGHPAIKFVRDHFDVGLNYAITEHIRNTSDIYYNMVGDELRSAKNNELRAQCMEYITGHFDIFVQVTLSLVAQLPTTSSASKLAIADVVNWIVSVLQYYFTVKNTIATAADADLPNVSWNLSQFDATKPAVDFTSIIAG